MSFQCALPVFDGLFDEPYNQAILELLFLCAQWHGLAKLRMHTDQTLELLDDVTISLGQQFRFFVNIICPDFKTRELPREAAARARRSKKPSTTGSGSGPISVSSNNTENTSSILTPPLSADADSLTTTLTAAPQSSTSTRRLKTLNLDTYKYHSLGDYTEMIRKYGTTDSYSTELVGLFPFF